MQFNPGDGSGIVDEILDLCDTDLTNYLIAKITRRVNAAYEQVVGWIIGADGTWKFDDTNYTTTPVGTIDLTEGQSSYSFNDKFLTIESVKVKDIYGYWHILTPLDQSELDMPLENYLIVNSMPRYYDKDGDDTFRLYPAPSASIVTCGVGTGGMKVAFQRTASLFATTDTTKAPGFVSPYHIILAYMAAIPYCMTYKKDRVALYEQQVLQLKADLIKLYARREKDKRKVMTSRPISFR